MLQAQGGTGASVAGNGNNGNGNAGGGTSTGADLDLGAVIRALRLNRAEGSADSNDLASDLDGDLEYGDQVDVVATSLSSGGSGMDGSSKEALATIGGG